MRSVAPLRFAIVILQLFICNSLLASGPLSPRDALETFELPEGFIIELVAAEPLVVDPVAIAWDARGRMYVAEMRDYPDATDPRQRGRIKLLTDRDGDGRMDQSTVFAEGLAFPNGVLPYREGVLVTAAPDVLYLADTDGDGKADVRQAVLTGFGEGNQQLRVNGLRYGLDNWIYGANGRSNGSLRFASQPDASAIPITNTDFRFRLDPPGKGDKYTLSGQLEPASGFSQFGLAFDDWGNRFISWNTIHIRHVVVERQYLQRNPHLALGDSTAHIADADHGDGGRVYQISRPQENFHSEPAGYFNATSGIEIDRGGIFPPPYAGSAFVGEPLRNIVHRDELSPHGATFIAQRGEQEKEHEFLASIDPWFRPVNMATGPDGSLYIADFYREWVEHPAFVPDEYEEGIDFYNGTDRGRIYRVRPRDAKPHIVADLSGASGEELVEQLSHPNGWYRETAKRLLIERGDRTVIPALRRAAASAVSPHARIYALRAMQSLADERTLGEFAELVERAAADPHPRVREHALGMMEDIFITSWPRQLPRFANDPDPRVRFQAALALGSLGGETITEALVTIARRDLDDPWARAAVLIAIGRAPEEFLHRWLAAAADEEPAAAEVDLLSAAAAIAAAQATSISPELAAVLDTFRDRGASRGLALLAGLAEGWRRAGQSIREKLSLVGGAELLARWLEIATRVAFDPAEPPHARRLGVQLLALAGGGEELRKLAGLIDPRTPAEVQQSVVAALAQSTDSQVAPLLLERWPNATGPLRRQIISAMFTSRPRVEAVLAAIEGGTIAATEVEVVPRYQLTRWPDAAIRGRAEKLFKTSGEGRQAIVERYQSALSLHGDAERGAALFAETCAVCHKVRGAGGTVGPDLSAIVSRPPRQLVEDILDPNRQVSPDFISYMAATSDGQVVMGTIGSETAAQITLRQPDGREATIPRDKITLLQSTGQSLMPEGFEQRYTPQDLADLTAFLRGG